MRVLRARLGRRDRAHGRDRDIGARLRQARGGARRAQGRQGARATNGAAARSPRGSAAAESCRSTSTWPGAALFEKLDPGEPLAALTLEGRDDEATDIIAMLLGRMAPGDPPEGCATVEQWGEAFVALRRAAATSACRARSSSPRSASTPICAQRSAIPRCCTAICITTTCCRIARAAGARSTRRASSASSSTSSAPRCAIRSIARICSRSSTSSSAASTSSVSCSGSMRAARAAGASRRPCCRRSGASRTATRAELEAALALARVLLDSSALRSDFLD